MSLNHLNHALSRTAEESFEIPPLQDALGVISLDFDPKSRDVSVSARGMEEPDQRKHPCVIRCGEN